MHCFKDSTGCNWNLQINVAAVKRVKTACGVDLSQISDDLIERFSSDPCLAVDVLYVLVKAQADAIPLTDEQFAERLGGDSLELAGEAFMQELIDFFPSRTRSMLQRAASKGKELQAAMVALAEKKTDDPELQSQIMSRFERSLEDAGKRFIDSLA